MTRVIAVAVETSNGGGVSRRVHEWMKLPLPVPMSESWEPTRSTKYGVVVAPFAGDGAKHGLRLSLGQTVHILEQCGGWFRGHCIGHKTQKGVFPASHIAIKPCHVINQGPYETVEPAEGPTAREVASMLREWHPLWKKLYLERDTKRFMAVRQAMCDLVEWRRQLLSTALTQDQERALCLRAAACIDSGNRLLGLAKVPRTEGGAVVDPDCLGPVELFRVHATSSCSDEVESPALAAAAATHASRHLRLSLRHACASSLELHFTLYDAQAGQFFSENFLVKSTKCGQSSFLANHAAVFMDVFRPEGQHLHLVVRVIRTGRLMGDKGAGDQENYRRPLACGVLDLGILPWDTAGETEHAIRLLTCNEADFHQLHELILRKVGHKLAPLQPSLGLSVCLRPVLDPEEGLPIVRMRGFPEVIMPGDVRNDLYLTLERADLAGPTKNIEARLLLVAADGRILQDCLSGGVGQGEPSYEWRSVVLCRTCAPRWGEAVHVRLPLEPLEEGAHVRCELRHCSARNGREPRLLACALLPLLLSRGTVLPNGPHELPLLRADLGAQARHESVHLTTLLVSTKLTQNRDLLALLRWKEQPDDVPQALLGLTKLDGEEIVKFLQDILDALFSMFSTADGNSTPYSGLVFKTLVYILSLLESPKFEHFKPVLDAYIKGHFAAALVYKGLLRCVVHCAELAADPGEDAVSVEQCFASLEAVMQFVMQSRLLLSRATGADPSEGFWADLQPMLAACERMLDTPEVATAPTSAQVSLVHSLGGLLVRLREVLPLSAVVRVAERFLAWLPARPHPLLAQARLVALERTITALMCDTADHGGGDEWRHRLVSACSTALGAQLVQGGPEEAPHCTQVLGQLVTVASRVDAAPALLPLVTPLLDTLHSLDDGAPLLGPLSACLLGVVRSLGETHYTQLWGGDGGREGIRRALLVLRRLLLGPTFPADWAVMRALANHVALGALQELAQLLASPCFLQPLDVPLWLQYLWLAADFVAQPCLQLEHLSPAQRGRLIDRYGDMRLLAGFQVLALWGRLWEEGGGAELAPSLVGPLVRMTLVREAELRRAMLPLFYDLMDKDLPRVEAGLMDQLDELVTAGSGDKQYQQLFTSILLEKVESRNPAWRESGVRFIHAVGRQLDRLLDYRSVLEGAENRDKRMSCTVNLLRFYREEVGRQEMFVRYVHKLCELHLPAEHFAEAAFALHLHADLLPWEEGERGRLKEQLSLRMLDYFDRGKCWEEGLPLCKELATVYEGVLFDYKKLSDILRTHAEFLEHILTELRPEPEYFRVGFIGLGFPSFLQNKVFVYRGLSYEKVGAFSQRLQGQFPEAQLLTYNAPPDAALLTSTDQYVQVCGVRPLPEPCPELEGRPECVRAYFRVNRVQLFQFDRPVYRDGPPDKDNEFKGLWLERTTLETASALPGLLPWAKVVGQRTEWVPPLAHACEAVEAMSNELRRLVALHSREPQRPLAPLSMRLAGAIEAAVNGGLAKYHQAFLSSGDASGEGQTRLRALLIDQVHVLEGGLSLHGRLAPSDLAPLQRRLVERLGQLQQWVRGASSCTSSAHGSPRPGSACSSSRSSASSSGLVPPPHDDPWDAAAGNSSSSAPTEQQAEVPAADGVPPPLPPRGIPPLEQSVTRPALANCNSLKHGEPHKSTESLREELDDENCTAVARPSHRDC